MMYGHTCQPPSESDDHKVGKVAIGTVAIHCLVIVAMAPRTSSNHAVRACCVACHHPLTGIK
jgi:hypothetical protein